MSPDTIPCLTICQPYAHLICLDDGHPDAKRVENRTWYTDYRGPLLIHAGKGRKFLAPGDEAEYPGMAFGAVVGVAELVGCVPARKVANPTGVGLPPHGLEIHPDALARWPWLRTHRHVEGPWCFVLAGVRRFAEPVPYRGAQGLFPVPTSAVAAALEAAT